MKSIRVDLRPLAAVLLLTLTLSACAAEGGVSSTQVPPTSAIATPLATTGALPPEGTPTQDAAAAPAEEATVAATNTAVQAPTKAPPAAGAPTAGAPTAGAPTAAPPTEPSPAAPTPAATPDLSNVQLGVTQITAGLSNPLYVTHARDGSGRLFVVEKTGAIRIVANGKLLEKPFLDVADRVRSSGSEQGLLGLAFPPEYATRKFFFVNYTDRNGDTVIARFNVTDDPNVAEPGSEFTVLTFDQPAPNHNGGDLVFGPDGYLWIGTGDGGAANDRFGNGQNPDTVLGKMLRLDVLSDTSKPYTIPGDNPSLSQGWKVRAEVWAIGLRNPWRYSFDRATGDLWIADVGQNRIEEVNVVRAGARGGLNFGWPLMEGPNCFQKADCDQAGLVLPVASYEHGANGCSVTGGFVYRGAQIPALQGVYLYGDYCTGRIWGLAAANPTQPRLLLEVGPGLSSFGQDEAGELYITDLSQGTVRQIVAK